MEIAGLAKVGSLGMNTADNNILRFNVNPGDKAGDY